MLVWKPQNVTPYFFIAMVLLNVLVLWAVWLIHHNYVNKNPLKAVRHGGVIQFLFSLFIMDTNQTKYASFCFSFVLKFQKDF